MAQASLREMLGVETLEGKSFLDVGSGSGLFSLAARELGARVISFDYDPHSVACTRELRRCYRGDDPLWEVYEGSVLDPDFLSKLGTFDVVYSWGVLHHTGRMWEALANVAPRVVTGGHLFIAIYNDQGRGSRRWLRVKRAYNALPSPFRSAFAALLCFRMWGPTIVRDSLNGQPLRTWSSYAQLGGRGMSPWRDVVDWVGGLPFEVAKPEQMLDFYRVRGFELIRLKTCAGGFGCNEFVFARAGENGNAEY